MTISEWFGFVLICYDRYSEIEVLCLRMMALTLSSHVVSDMKLFHWWPMQ